MRISRCGDPATGALSKFYRLDRGNVRIWHIAEMDLLLQLSARDQKADIRIASHRAVICSDHAVVYLDHVARCEFQPLSQRPEDSEPPRHH
jgi:hypothetical protein